MTLSFDAVGQSSEADRADHDLLADDVGVKSAFNDYVLAAQEIGALQFEIIALREKQIAEGLAWARNAPQGGY